ncbi:MAG: hypothetical protein ABSD21_09220 [Rhizomicrobium sp.]
MQRALPPLSSFKTPRAAAAAVLALGCIASCVVNFPGSLEDDSFVQLLEGRRGVYGFWHTPVLSWLLGLSDRLIPGTGIYVLVLTVLTFAALTSLLWLVPRVSWAAVIGAAVLVCLPQLLLFQAIVWKDVLFADACLIGFVCLAHAGARWRMRRLRFALIGLSAGFLALAMLARQNGAIMLPCAAVALGAIAAVHEKRWRVGAAYAAVLAVASGAAALAANAALELRSDGTPALEMQFKTLQLYDTVGMVKKQPGLHLSVLDKDAPELARLIRTDGVRLYSPVKNDTLENSWRIVVALDEVPAAVLSKQWRELVFHHPGTYLAVRAELFSWLFLPTHVGLCHPYHVGDEGSPDDLAALGMHPRMDRRDVILGNYGKAFVGTPVFAHPAFGLVAILALALLMRRRRPADLAMAGLLAATLLFTLSFFVISIACDYRYLYALDISAIAAALYLLADWPTKKGA